MYTIHYISVSMCVCSTRCMYAYKHFVSLLLYFQQIVLKGFPQLCFFNTCWNCLHYYTRDEYRRVNILFHLDMPATASLYKYAFKIPDKYYPISLPLYVGVLDVNVRILEVTQNLQDIYNRVYNQKAIKIFCLSEHSFDPAGISEFWFIFK